MAEVKDYTGGEVNTHYNGVPSWYGKLAAEQHRDQPKYCWPGEADGKPLPKAGNKQEGP